MTMADFLLNLMIEFAPSAAKWLKDQATGNSGRAKSGSEPGEGRVRLLGGAFYSDDKNAVIAAVALANANPRRDKAVSWRLQVADHFVLHPGQSDSGFAVEPLPWWYPELVSVEADDYIHGALYFPGNDALREAMKNEPLKATLRVSMLRSGDLELQLEIYRFATLRQQQTGHTTG